MRTGRICKPEFQVGLTGLAQRRADDLEQVVVIDAACGKTPPRPLVVARSLLFKSSSAGDDDDGNFLRRIQPMKPFHDAKTVPRHAAPRPAEN